jgi:hypothetical protein
MSYRGKILSFLLLVTAFIPIVISPNTPGVMFPIVVALLATFFVLHVLHYKIISFASIFILISCIQYPVAALLVLWLPYPEMSLETELWNMTPETMWMYTMSILFFLLGVLIVKKIQRRQFSNRFKASYTIDRYDILSYQPYFLYILLFAGLVAVVINIQLGTYYHKNVQSYNISNAVSYGLVGYLYYISYIGITLQVVRYSITHSKRDAFHVAIMVILTIAMYAPSGARRFILTPLVIAFLFYIAFNRDTRRTLLVVVGFIAILSVSLPILEAYRSVSVHAASYGFFEKILVMVEGFANFDLGGENSMVFFVQLLGRRLADYVSVGYIIDYMQSGGEYYGFSDLIYMPIHIIPTLLKPDSPLIYTYDAIIMNDLGFRPVAITGGSSPLMLIGDFYLRGGALAVSIGMFIMGVLMTYADIFIYRLKVVGLMIIVFSFDNALSMHSYTILKVFTFFTKQLLIYFILSYGVSYAKRIVKNSFFVRKNEVKKC